MKTLFAKRDRSALAAVVLLNNDDHDGTAAHTLTHVDDYMMWIYAHAYAKQRTEYDRVGGWWCISIAHIAIIINSAKFRTARKRLCFGYNSRRKYQNIYRVTTASACLD